MKIKELFEYGKSFLRENEIEDYNLIAKILLEYICNIEKNKLIICEENDVDDEKIHRYMDFLNKIKEGIPLQYLTNNQEFMGLNFYVDENVLIPQPDTEILVEEVVQTYKNKSCKILDLCTGSGAIAISVAKYLEDAMVVASDISEKAIQVSKLNAEKNLVRKKIEFKISDLFDRIEENDFDAIVSNPPYIETDTISNLSMQVRNEPFIALDGGFDGLKFYKAIIDQAWKYIKDNGKLYLEIGYNQKQAVENLLVQNKKYDEVYSKKDLGGNDRIVVATVRR